MHHLGPNSVLYFTCFATLCKAYLGFLPFPSFFRFFQFRAQAHDNMLYSCGDAVVYTRHNGPFTKMKWIESFKKWQCTFFYVRGIVLGWDWVDLPPFVNSPPTGELEPQSAQRLAHGDRGLVTRA
ncbi:hypothetical protein D1007_20693 [Hordeum vulgare]|nr:hypothetical protein D1007_20693 [Hordeum vulgare]